MPIDPFIENADQWDRDDGLDDYFGETKQQMAERLERQYPPHNNGKAGEVVSLSTGARLDGMPAHEKPAPFPWLDMSRWDDEPVPPRKWAIPDRVPANQAGLFSGEGGTGKSIIELMKDVAHVAGKDWLGSMPDPGPAFYIGAEDEADEIRRRLDAIAAHHGVTFKELIAGGLYVRSMLGEDATLCVVGRCGKVETTPLYRQLYEAAGDIKPQEHIHRHPVPCLFGQ